MDGGTIKHLQVIRVINSLIWLRERGGEESETMKMAANCGFSCQFDIRIKDKTLLGVHNRIDGNAQQWRGIGSDFTGEGLAINQPLFSSDHPVT